MKGAAVTVLNPLAQLRRFYEAENEFCRLAPDQRDIRLMLAELDPDVVVDVPASLPHGGVWRGHAGFRELFDVVTTHWEQFEVVYDYSCWHQVDAERVLIECSLRGVLRSSGGKIDMPVASLLTFTERGVSRLDHFYKDSAAIVAAV